jgi:D-xylose transport system substrate-binding protein
MSNPALMRRLIGSGSALLAVGLLLAGCGGGSGGGTKIALLLPETETPRYESDDRPDFENAVEDLCEDCEVLYDNAGGDASKQQTQAEAALTKGAEVLVVDPIDSKAAAEIAAKAQAQKVPVVSYDRLIENAEVDAYVSFDNEKVGELQAETLAKKLKEDGSANGPVIMINGDPVDPNAALLKKGAHNGFDAAGVTVAEEYATPGWSAENAQRGTQQAIAVLGKNGFAGVYAANDDTAGGAITALKGAGIDPEDKPVTGQDATLAALQRIIAGQQYMTVYKEIEPEATVSAEIAIALAEGEAVPRGLITEEIDNGKTDVPSAILEPVAVTKDNVKSTVVADGFVSASELCAEPYKDACEEAGISG